MIKVENIKGDLLLIGASDDVLWDTVRYIRRMEERLKNTNHECNVIVATYEHGTHFIFPESMLKKMIPVFSGIFVKLAFKEARKYPDECKKTRIDIDKKVRKAIEKWKER